MGTIAGVTALDELDALPGVGPATAAAIVAHREANGPFASIDSLGDVRGIGPAKLEAIRPLVSL
jgi:competence protein ComEA